MARRARCYFCRRTITQKRAASFVDGFPFICCESCERWAAKLRVAEKAALDAQKEAMECRRLMAEHLESLGPAARLLLAGRYRELAADSAYDVEVTLKADEEQG